MTVRSAIIAAVTLAGLSLPAAAQPASPLTSNPAEVQPGRYTLDASHGKISWSLSHLGFSTYVGQFHDVAATLVLDVKNPAASRLDATIAMNSAGTFNKGLDQHLQSADFFDVANHPTARFTASRITLLDARTARIDGQLTLRGVTRPVSMKAQFNQAGVNPVSKLYTIGFDGEATIRRSEFGMQYGLPLLGDDVTLKLEAEFVAASGD
ncbi:YceI family protein [Sandaracinobacteroides sp. A072]|uniref:YceI family protein n=1 Tax=Sandaracinobacteroides sp. A072 TaxID=3461146 RepID=UPI004042953E